MQFEQNQVVMTEAQQFAARSCPFQQVRSTAFGLVHEAKMQHIANGVLQAIDADKENYDPNVSHAMPVQIKAPAN